MLCPKCGAEVGERSQLCDTCSSSEDGATLGRINVKQIRKEVTPEEREEYERQKAAYHEGHEERVTFTSSSAGGTAVSKRKRKTKVSNLPFFVVLVALLAAFTVGGYLLSPHSTESRTPYDQFAHIPDKRTGDSAIPSTDGTLFLNRSSEGLRQSKIAYDPERSLLSVHFTHATLRSPRLFLEYRLAEDSRLFDLANVVSIRAELITETGVQHFDIPRPEDSSSHRLSGLLGRGKEISGAMNFQGVLKDADGNDVRIRWEVRFKGQL